MCCHRLSEMLSDRVHDNLLGALLHVRVSFDITFLKPEKGIRPQVILSMPSHREVEGQPLSFCQTHFW